MTEQIVLRLTPEERLAAIAVAGLPRPIGMMPLADDDAALDIGVRHLATRGWVQLTPEGATLEEPLPAILRVLVAADEVLAVVVTAAASTSVQSWYVTGDLGAMYDHHDDGLEAIIVRQAADVARSAGDFTRAWWTAHPTAGPSTYRFAPHVDLARAAIAGEAVEDLDGATHRPLMSASFSGYRLGADRLSRERVDLVVFDGPAVHVVERTAEGQRLRPVAPADLRLLDRLGT
jgi:hypothetical protein